MTSARRRCTSSGIASTSAVHVVTLWGVVMGSEMKLSEAIREGIKKDGYQAYGQLFEIREDKVVGCCALGAAALGIGMNPLGYANRDKMADAVMERLVQLFPCIHSGTLQCPECGKLSLFWGVTSHLNDTHGWSRESIADFWESQGQ